MEYKYVCDICKLPQSAPVPNDDLEAFLRKQREDYERTYGIPFDPDEVGEACDSCEEQITQCLRNR